MTMAAPSMAAESVPPQPPPRKRRRKTASGAHEDCFACRRKGVACDRKRPYCTPCIDLGRECPGYKTTLTWNVGVASRGKLRGLSCPVTTKSSDGSDATLTSEQGRCRKTSSSSGSTTTTNTTTTDTTTTTATATKPRTSPKNIATKIKVEEQALEPNATASASYQPIFAGPTSAPTHTYQPPLPTIHAGQAGWQTSSFHDTYQHGPLQQPPVLRHPSLQMIQTALGSQYDPHGHPHSASSVGSYPETEFHSPKEYPQTPSSIHYAEPFPSATPIPFANQSLAGSVDSYADTLSSSIDSLQSAFSFPDENMVEQSMSDLQMYHQSNLSGDELLFSPVYDVGMNINPFDQLDEPLQEEEIQDHKDLALLEPRFSSPFFHVTPRLQSLMEYYDRHICPYLVAFDDIDNPYRKHILQLAVHNEGLQNALAALSTNNLRMRKSMPSKQLGFVEEITGAFDSSTKLDSSEPSAEETCYKQMSIDQLNMQLTDSRAAQDDGVLATLLILCLFHVCDSGFSKFKTQLAGVQKLLSLRHPSGRSDFTRWVEMFFIWFDVMTSAVNDREMQIKPESLDMLDYSANLGALEQFSGCDGRLFKLIARLGRLNLLAQGRPVRSQDQTPTSPIKRKYMHDHPMLHRKRSQPRSLSPADYEHLDGNGWGPSLFSLSSSEDDETPTSHPTTSATSFDFWSEYNDIRSRLECWQPLAPPAGPSPSPSESIDHYHINSAFRSAALLYTSRLAYPHLPSAHPTLQAHVATALAHITALAPTSCVNKFLLWPLFVIGTECVDAADRHAIRARCWEVARESGFYNNLSGLEVLERVWREAGRGGADVQREISARRRDCAAAASAFRWRRAMHRVDGEYIVI